MKYKGDDGANYLIAQGYSAVGIVTRLRTAKTMYPVSIPSRGKNFSSFLKSPYRQWCYPSYSTVVTGEYSAEG